MDVHDALLSAVSRLSTDDDLRDLLAGIVRSACHASGARYGALGVIGPSGSDLVEFVTEGLSQEERDRIGPLPRGKGLLGHLISHPGPLRTADLASHPAATGFPPGHPTMSSFLGIPVRVRGRVFGNLYLTDKESGASFTDADEHAVLALAGLAGLAVEHAHLLVTAQRRSRWFEATALMRAEVQRAEAPPDCSETILNLAATAAQARGALLVATSSTDTVEAVVVTRGGTLGRPVADLLAALTPVVVGAAGTPTTPSVAVGDDHLLVAPMTSAPEATFLVLVLPGGRDPEIDAADGELLLGFADHTAAALDRRRAETVLHELAVVAERDRIARDLHDVVIQRLFAVGLRLTSVSAGVDQPFKDRVETVIDDLDVTIDEIRSTIGGLHPTLRTRSLRQRVRDLVTEYAEILGFRPELRFTGPLDTVVPVELHHDVVAILREGLSNVARHAGAATVRVRVEADLDLLTCTVLDDGVGVRSGAARSGLSNLAARAAARDGTFEVAPGEKAGTRIVWRVPLQGGSPSRTR